MSELLSVQQARERILAVFQPVESMETPLREAAGRVLAQDVLAGVFLPAYTNSSMDGFALRAADTASASRERPVELEIVEDIPAGRTPAQTITPGTCARIMTGAMLPPGADAVVPVEDTNLERGGLSKLLPERVTIYRSVDSGAYLRLRGQDLQPDRKILSRGQSLRPADVGMLAACGIAGAPVYRRPRLALLSSGDELTAPGEPLPTGKIYDANSYALAALAQEDGCEVVDLGVAPDDLAQVQARLEEAAALGCDLILTSAGVSVGAFDYVRKAIETEGALDFWRVNMRPGKPVAFGRYRSVPLIGLPGNPVSAIVTYMVFVRPAIRRLSGLADSAPQTLLARLVEPVESDGRESYLRAVLQQQDGEYTVRLTGDQNSGNIFSLVQANALLIVPSGVKSLPVDTAVDVWPLRNET